MKYLILILIAASQIGCATPEKEESLGELVLLLGSLDELSEEGK